jgi:hypothetical protein
MTAPKKRTAPTKAARARAYAAGRTPPDAAQVVATLERMADKTVRDGMGRFGIPSDKALGITVGALRQLGKTNALRTTTATSSRRA